MSRQKLSPSLPPSLSHVLCVCSFISAEQPLTRLSPRREAEKGQRRENRGAPWQKVKRNLIDSRRVPTKKTLSSKEVNKPPDFSSTLTFPSCWRGKKWPADFHSTGGWNVTTHASPRCIVPVERGQSTMPMDADGDHVSGRYDIFDSIFGSWLVTKYRWKETVFFFFV